MPWHPEESRGAGSRGQGEQEDYFSRSNGFARNAFCEALPPDWAEEAEPLSRHSLAGVSIPEVPIRTPVATRAACRTPVASTGGTPHGAGSRQFSQAGEPRHETGSPTHWLGNFPCLSSRPLTKFRSEETSARTSRWEQETRN